MDGDNGAVGNDKKREEEHTSVNPLRQYPHTTNPEPTRTRVRQPTNLWGIGERCKDTARIGAKIQIRVRVAANTVGKINYKIVFHKFELDSNS